MVAVSIQRGGNNMSKRGLYANIHAKRKRIAEGSGEKMRKVGDKGAPTKKDFVESAKTAKAMYGGEMKRRNMRGGGYTSMNKRYANGGKIYPKVGM